MGKRYFSPIAWLNLRRSAVKVTSASEMTYIVSSGALTSTHSPWKWQSE